MSHQITPDNIGDLYAGTLDFTESRRNPLPRSEEWLRAEAEAMVSPTANERAAYVDDHYRALKTIDGALSRAMRRTANDNRRRVR